ncbi:MAG: hypothetical protein HOG88_04590 [Sulfurimonas sp.]|jgi:hypothetical protein|nr:hypothetical protein [Sulfurimonas sp.]
MRVIPFGVELVKDGYSFEAAVSLMNQDSAITHKNETIFMANRLALDIAYTARIRMLNISISLILPHTYFYLGIIAKIFQI